MATTQGRRNRVPVRCPKMHLPPRFYRSRSASADATSLDVKRPHRARPMRWIGMAQAAPACLGLYSFKLRLGVCAHLQSIRNHRNDGNFAATDAAFVRVEWERDPPGL